MTIIKKILSRGYSRPGILVCLIFALSCGIVTKNTDRWWENQILQWDVVGYYNYIPSIFVYGDIKKVAFYPEMSQRYRPSGDYHTYGFHSFEGSDVRVNQYPCGVAVFELPTFFIAHAYAHMSEKYPADGYSPPYQLSVAISSLLFAAFGLFMIRSLLLGMGYSRIVSAIVLAILGFGTNVYYYASVGQGLGHVYSFFLLAVIMWCTYRMIQQRRLRYFVGIGLALGLATIVRPVDILFGLLPILWIASKQNIIEFVKQNMRNILVALLCFVVAISPQLIYWKYLTGDWVYYSYREEGFDFTNPHILKGLFSYAKGWYVYTPLALLGTVSLLVGCFVGRYRRLCQISTLILAIYIYVVFSWWMWFYGGSFGSRVMINVLPLLAVPFAMCIRWLSFKIRGVLVMAGVVIFLFIALNLFQTFQYHRGTIHWSGMSKEYYWRVFLKEFATPEDLEYLEKR